MEKELEVFDERIITLLQEYSTFKEIFGVLSDEEKDKYFLFLYSTYYLGLHLKTKDDDFVIDYIKKYYHILGKVETFSFYQFILHLKDRMRILEVIDLIPDKIIASYVFRDYVSELKNDEEKMLIIDKIVGRYEDIYILIKKLENDENKIKYLDSLELCQQVNVIKSFENEELKKEYVLKPEYSNFRSELVVSVKDKDFIISVFDMIENKKFRCNLIDRIEDNDLKETLIKRLGYTSLNKFIDSLKSKDESIDLDNDVSDKITIGVELETCHKDIDVLKIIKDLPYNFKIKNDSSVRSGFEVVSPILHYSVEDMSKLKHICDILNENNFYENETCGGHIHIGADYLETIEEYKMLLHLYCNFEDIIYLICNRANTKERPSVNRYAAKTKKHYSKIAKDGIFENDYEDVQEFCKKLVNLQDSRYKGLNLYNLRAYGKNTIEFRMANGEIDFEELRHNIKLYAKLIQVSKELANPENENRNEILEKLNTSHKDIERLNILLDLLFTKQDDKDFYKNRYKRNIKSLRDMISQMITKTEIVQIVLPTQMVLTK